MLIECRHCFSIVGCVNEDTNKTEECESCSDQSFCTACLNEDEQTISGICRSCRKEGIMMIQCPSCDTPLSLNGEEKFVKCSACGAKLHAGLLKMSFIAETKHQIKACQICKHDYRYEA